RRSSDLEFEFNYELGLAPQFDLNFSSKDKLPLYEIKLDEKSLEAKISNLRKSYGKMTNPDVSAEDDVIYGEFKQLDASGNIFEEGISNTGSLRIDLVKDAKIKKSLIGLKKEDTVQLDLQKAFDKDAHRISHILNISEEDAADLKSNF